MLEVPASAFLEFERKAASTEAVLTQSDKKLSVCLSEIKRGLTRSWN